MLPGWGMRLSRADLSYLVLETPAAPMHMCALAVLDRAVPLELLRATVHGRLPPVMKQRLEGREWVDDERLEMRDHVFEAPAEELERLIASPLDRTKPLWQLTSLTAGERPMLLIKLHHAVADGLGAIALLSRLFGAELPAPAAAAAPGRRRLLGVLPSRAPRSSLNQPVGAGRRLCWARLDLEAVRTRARDAGGRVNDVLLDVVAASLRPLLAARGELTPGLVLKVSVPVSLRSAPGAGGGGNQVGGMIVELPVGEPFDARRLCAIVAATGQAKAEQSAALIPAVVGRIARGSRWLFAHQHLVNLFVTNVRGPSSPLPLLGARVVDLIPITLPCGNVGLTFAGLSYAGSLYVSATADATHFPDFGLLAEALSQQARSYPCRRSTRPPASSWATTASP